MCGYCKKQYSLLKPLIDQGELQVRWVLVGYLREESPGIAAHILMGKNSEEKSERLAKHEKENSIKPLIQDHSDLVNNAVFASVGKNSAFFDEFAPYFVGTPTFLFINDQHQPQFHPGMITEEKMKAVFSHVSSSWSL
jgi:thiol:disulfide interchange protein DsbG